MIRKKIDIFMDFVSTFASFSVIVGLVWCVTDSLIDFVIGLITIELGTALFIIIAYLLGSKWKKFKDILIVSKRLEKDQDSKRTPSEGAGGD